MSIMKNLNGEWKPLVKKLAGRRSFVNPELSQRIVKELGYDKMYNNETTVLDMYPGCSVFSAALNNAIKPKKYILMEYIRAYSRLMNKLESPHVYIERNDGYKWSVFKTLDKSGVLQVPTTDASVINPYLLYTGNLLHPQGEQLVAQYLNCILNQSWILRYGRVRLLLWMRPKTAEKILAPVKATTRSRISLLRDTIADFRLVAYVPEDEGGLQHIKPMIDASEFVPKQDFAARLKGFALVELTPNATRVQNVDDFEYVIKTLMIKRRHPVKECLDYLGPGAAHDLGSSFPELLDTTPSELTVEQAMKITNAFSLWPFKPRLLLDFYEETMTGRGFGSE